MIGAYESIYTGLLRDGMHCKPSAKEVANVVTLMFSKVQLAKIAANEQVPRALRIAILERLSRFKILSENKENAQEDPQIKQWLKPRFFFFSADNPEELIKTEQKASIALLGFPAQETGCLPESRFYEEGQIEGSRSIRVHFESNESADQLPPRQLFPIQRLLFVHPALIDPEGKPISWLQVLHDWAHEDVGRMNKLMSLINLFNKPLTQDVKLPVHNPQEAQRAVGKTLTEYLIDRTVRVLEARMGFELKPADREAMTKKIEYGEAVRLDVTYYTQSNETLENYPYIGQRYSQSLIQTLSPYFALKKLCNTPEEREALFHYVSKCPKGYAMMAPYCFFRPDFLSENSITFSEMPPFQFRETDEAHDQLYLVLFFRKYPAFARKLREQGCDTQVISVPEFLALFHDQPRRMAQLFEPVSDSFYSRMAQVAPFNTSQLRFLSLLQNEADFAVNSTFIKEFFEVVGKPADPALAFSFLISRMSLGQELHNKILLKLVAFTEKRSDQREGIAQLIELRLKPLCIYAHTKEIPARIRNYLMPRDLDRN